MNTTERKPRTGRCAMVNRLSGTALKNALAELDRRRKVYGKALDLRNRAWEDYQKQRAIVQGDR